MCTEAGLLALRERRMRVTHADFSKVSRRPRPWGWLLLEGGGALLLTSRMLHAPVGWPPWSLQLPKRALAPSSRLRLCAREVRGCLFLPVSAFLPTWTAVGACLPAAAGLLLRLSTQLPDAAVPGLLQAKEKVLYKKKEGVPEGLYM